MIKNNLSHYFFLASVSVAIVNAATLPPGFTETSITGLSNPTAMEIAPDGRIFVCQQGGSLRVIKNGVLLSTPFLTLSVDPNGERGLLGIAFDPNFASNNFLYVYYTVPSTPRHNRVSRFTANGDVVVPGSEHGHSRTRQSELSNKPQRRRDPLRTGRQAVRRGRRERQRIKRANVEQQARESVAHQFKRHDPDRQSVLQHGRGRQSLDLGVRPPQSIHVRFSTGNAAGCSSTTSARLRGKRSTTALPVQIMVGTYQRRT